MSDPASDPLQDPSLNTDGPGGETADYDGAPNSITPTLQRGVDRASAFDVSEARTLHDKHGVTWTGVYIGGACSGGSGWSKSVVESLHNAVGWRFMPIFVGQQSSSICHAHTVTAAQGKADGEHAASIMKSYDWLGHRAIPVALDVEAGTYSSSPSGSTAYVKAWVAAVHAAGYLAYVYSSPTGLVHFHDADIGVNGGWCASYFYDAFESVTPGDLHQLGNRFVHDNRAWQYAGDFEVAGVGRVDANTSHLLLAPPPGGTNIAKTKTDSAD
nr:glycoside hydrolase domain-containing protein [Kofleriaceae bacterium]